MFFGSPRFWFGFLTLLIGFPNWGRAETIPYSWTVLTPENDSRAADVRDYDEFTTRSLVKGMNETESVFHHHLVWNKIALKDLLAASAPYCELRFDAVKPLVLTDQEKSILKEYLTRGGFILLVEDAYPYSQDEYWSVTSWPVVDFLIKELPATNPDFKAEKATDAHPIFHQYYNTDTVEAIRHELEDNPSAPGHILLTYRNHPSVFIIGSYYFLKDGKWIAMPRPYAHVFGLDPKSYKLNVNIYVYTTMH